VDERGENSLTPDKTDRKFTETIQVTLGTAEKLRKRLCEVVLSTKRHSKITLVFLKALNTQVTYLDHDRLGPLFILVRALAVRCLTEIGIQAYWSAVDSRSLPCTAMPAEVLIQ